MKHVWFYRPSWYWFGWSSLLPIQRGHDEHARWTVMLGWPITGRVIIAITSCNDFECHAQAREDELEASAAA